uniref:PDZ domain-containing protein n=1 Tax=Plectus sambesii TaxID=2011161 RepID=A0A914V670_9BILA
MGGRHCAQTELIKERLAKCEWLRIQLRRRRPTDRFGFTIVGGQQDGVGLYVKCVEVDSPADLAGLKEGDEVVVAEARDARILTRDDFVRLSVRRCSLTMFVKRK